MKKVGFRETEARPGRPCWDWICGLEYMSNTRKAHAGTLAAEIRRQKRCADAEGLASKLCNRVKNTRIVESRLLTTHVRERLLAVVCEKHQADAFANSVAKNHHPPDQRPRAVSRHI